MSTLNGSSLSLRSPKSCERAQRRFASGALPHVREGRLLRVLANDLDRYLAANRHLSDVSDTLSH